MARGGIHVTVASVMSQKLCKLSRGMKVEADALLSELRAHHYDVIVLPGGMPGAKHFAGSSALVEMLQEQKKRGGWYAAICAAPAVVFKSMGIVDKEKMTCYDYHTFRDEIKSNFVPGRVVVDGKCITSVGPGSAIEFGLGIVECLVGKDMAATVCHELMVSSREPVSYV
jgi:4-methyl-5(b-hydroxyethyl)-thiazole monophosphate biosynthesis